MARYETRSPAARAALHRMRVGATPAPARWSRSPAEREGRTPRADARRSRPEREAASAWRLLPPLLGVAVSLLAWCAQNVWHLFDIRDLTQALRGLDPRGLALALALIGLIEGTVVVCFYLPGTAVVILLLAGLQPSWDEALPLLAALGAGTLAGYGASAALGRALAQALPRLVGPAAFARMRSSVERFGLAAFAAAAAHPNPCALAFAVLGYLGVRRVRRCLAVAALAQGAWWTLYAAMAGAASRQTVVTGGNFQLVLAGLFSIWLAYELARHGRGR